MRPIVVIESPYSNGGLLQKLENSIDYAHEICRHSLSNGESPIASHLLYTQFLDDADKVERLIGIECGMSFAPPARAIAFYIDLGLSDGMLNALAIFAGNEELSRKVLFRSIRGNLGRIQAISHIWMDFLTDVSDLPESDRKSLIREYMEEFKILISNE